MLRKVSLCLLLLTASCSFEPAWALQEHRQYAAELEVTYKLPTGLLRGICEVESNWIHPTKRGTAGEVGLCQVKPTTALDMCPECEHKVGNLHQGMHSKSVRELQELLKKYGYDPGTIDGVFGLRTHIAVTLFQSAHKLKADGVVGPRTWKALGISNTSIVEYLQNPYNNMRIAARYLVWLGNKMGTDDPDILAALYNGGHRSRAADYMLKVRRANE